MYEIATCEWQHFSLMQEKFEEWNPPLLPKNFSESACTLYKKYLNLIHLFILTNFLDKFLLFLKNAKCFT